MESFFSDKIGNGHRFDTHGKRVAEAMMDHTINLQIQSLVDDAKNLDLSKRRRRKVHNDARELCRDHFCQDFGSSDSAADYLSVDTASGNSSVSEVTAVSSDSDGTKKWWHEHQMFGSDSEDELRFRIFLDGRKEQKTERRTKEKKAAKAAAAKARAVEAAAAEAAAAKAAVVQRRRKLDAALKEPLNNIPFLFSEIPLYWDPKKSHWIDDRSRHQLFKNVSSPSLAQILDEIGPVAWDRILHRRFCDASNELDFFREQNEADLSSSMFASSLFDSDASDADDESE